MGRPVRTLGLPLTFAFVAVIACVALPADEAAAQAPLLVSTVGWDGLNAQQREALAPLQRDWAGIDAARQRKWLDVAARFPSLSVDERLRVQQRMTEWARLSPGDRGRARLNFQDLRQIAPEERQTRWEAYQSLPPERRQALAAQASKNAQARPSPGARVDGAKSAVIAAPAPQPAVRPVAPTVVQSATGATTKLVSQPVTPPPHQQTGLPKIAAKPGFVDPNTLLPRRGLQGAGMTAPKPGNGDVKR